MWYFLRSCNDSDLIQRSYLWAETSVDAEDFAVDNSAEDEEIEDLTAGFPNRGIAIFLLTLLVETVDLGYLTGFVVTPNESYTVWVSAGC